VLNFKKTTSKWVRLLSSKIISPGEIFGEGESNQFLSLKKLIHLRPLWKKIPDFQKRSRGKISGIATSATTYIDKLLYL